MENELQALNQELESAGQRETDGYLQQEVIHSRIQHSQCVDSSITSQQPDRGVRSSQSVTQRGRGKIEPPKGRIPTRTRNMEFREITIQKSIRTTGCFKRSTNPTAQTNTSKSRNQIKRGKR